MYKIKIDGNFYEPLQGFEDNKIVKTFRRNYNEKVCRFQYLWENVTFTSDIYDYLWNRFTTDGSGYSIDLDLYEYTGSSYELVEHKSIQMPTAKFKPQQKTVTVDVNDKNYELYFFGAKNQKCYTISTKSRNGSDIDAANWGSYQFFDPLDGDYFTFARGYRVYEVLKHMIAFYSNGNITFESDYFFDGDGKDRALFSAIELVEKSGRTAPDISWQDLLEDLYITDTIWVYIEGTLDNPIFKLEPESYGFRDSVNSTILKDKVYIDSIETVERMVFSKIVTGSSNALPYDPDSDQNFKDLLFRGFTTEDYNLEGDYISRGELDLQINNLIVDSNSIESQIKTNNIEDAEYTSASDVFMICGVSGVVSPTIGLFKYNQYQELPYYNEPFITQNIVKKHLEGIPENIINYLNSLSYFEGETSSPIVSSPYPTTKTPINPQSEVADPNDIYNLVNQWILTKVSDNISIELDLNISVNLINPIQGKAVYQMKFVNELDSADLPTPPTYNYPSGMSFLTMLSDDGSGKYVDNRELYIANQVYSHKWVATGFVQSNSYCRAYLNDTILDDERFTIHSSVLKIKGTDFNFELTTDSNIRWRLINGSFKQSNSEYADLVSLSNRYGKSIISSENCNEKQTYNVWFQELKKQNNGRVDFTAFAKDRLFVNRN